MRRLSRPQGQTSALWLQPCAGSGTLTFGEELISVGAGQAVWIRPGQPFSFQAAPEGWTVDWLMADGPGLSFFLDQHPVLGQATLFQLTQPGILHQHLQSLLENGLDCSPAAVDRKSVQVYGFLLAMERQVKEKPAASQSGREQRLQPVLDFIASHYHESITLDMLARILEVTPQHLCTIFRKVTGQRVFEYINQVRIQASKADLIANPDKPVRDIAHDCGFDDVSYFCSIFKRFEQTTPGDFRRVFYA
jgi:AraC-like DNA-binding protein